MWEKRGRETLALFVLPSALAINFTCMHILWTFNSFQGKLHFTPCGLVIVYITPLRCTYAPSLFGLKCQCDEIRNP